MNREDIDACRAFGSRARGDAGTDSDTDIIVEIDPEAPVTIYDYVAIKEYKEYIISLSDGGLMSWIGRVSNRMRGPQSRRMQSMPSDAAVAIRRWLNDILHNIELAESFVADLDALPRNHLRNIAACLIR